MSSQSLTKSTLWINLFPCSLIPLVLLNGCGNDSPRATQSTQNDPISTNQALSDSTAGTNLEFDGVLKAGLNPEIEPVIWGSLGAGPLATQPYSLFTLPKIGLNIYAKAELELASTDSDTDLEITHPTAEGTYKGADPLTLNAQRVGTPEVVIYGGVDFTLRDGSVEDDICPIEDSTDLTTGVRNHSLDKPDTFSLSLIATPKGVIFPEKGPLKDQRVIVDDPRGKHTRLGNYSQEELLRAAKCPKANKPLELAFHKAAKERDTGNFGSQLNSTAPQTAEYLSLVKAALEDGVPSGGTNPSFVHDAGYIIGVDISANKPKETSRYKVFGGTSSAHISPIPM
ncbi:MAG: hypothetical protein HC921_21525 [Synechococcaceae cyanobacterium SM2_3_1]|nr:hypothetical protein [Synechococcaceae cyanobacterium SM2_3_1]